MDEASQERAAPEAEAGAGTGPSLSSSAAGDEGALVADDEGFEIYDEELDEDEDGRPETMDERGRRHVRLAAPEGTEEVLEKEAARRTSLPDWAERWRSRSATGSVLTAVAFGLKEVFEPERKEPAIVMETSGEPPKELPVEANLEQLGPRQSSVTVRPWLLGAGEEEAVGGSASTPQRDAENGEAGQA